MGWITVAIALSLVPIVLSTEQPPSMRAFMDSFNNESMMGYGDEKSHIPSLVLPAVKRLMKNSEEKKISLSSLLRSLTEMMDYEDEKPPSMASFMRSFSMMDYEDYEDEKPSITSLLRQVTNKLMRNSEEKDSMLPPSLLFPPATKSSVEKFRIPPWLRQYGPESTASKPTAKIGEFQLLHVHASIPKPAQKPNFLSDFFRARSTAPSTLDVDTLEELTDCFNAHRDTHIGINAQTCSSKFCLYDGQNKKIDCSPYSRNGKATYQKPCYFDPMHCIFGTSWKDVQANETLQAKQNANLSRLTKEDVENLKNYQWAVWNVRKGISVEAYEFCKRGLGTTVPPPFPPGRLNNYYLLTDWAAKYQDAIPRDIHADVTKMVVQHLIMFVDTMKIVTKLMSVEDQKQMDTVYHRLHLPVQTYLHPYRQLTYDKTYDLMYNEEKLAFEHYQETLFYVMQELKKQGLVDPLERKA